MEVFYHSSVCQANGYCKRIWHACCGRLQAVIDRHDPAAGGNGSNVTLATILNTDFKGQSTHTASVSTNPVTAQAPGNSGATADWHNPVDADTLRETITRFDGRGRPTHSTVWLVPFGTVDDDARPNLPPGNAEPQFGENNIPIAGSDILI